MNEHLEKLAASMREAGVEHAFGIPGSGPSLTVIDAFERLGGKFHLTHFEGTAAVMAGTMGRLTGRAGVCLGIKGPGLANMVPGLAACALEAFPVVSVTEAYLPDAPPRSSHKRLDHLALVSGVAKEAHHLSAKGPDFADLAGRAEAECPGPVHLDIFGAPCPEPRATVFRDPAPNTGDVADCLARMEKSHRPVVIAGTLAIRLGLHERLNRLNVPVFTTAAAKGAVDETLDHAAGVYTGVGRELVPETALLGDADLIVGIGLRHNEVLGGYPLPVDAVQLDPLGEDLWSGFGFAASGLPAGQAGWDEIFEALASRSWGADRIQEARERLDQALLRHGDMPANVFVAVERLYAGRARLAMDTGIYCTVGEHVWRVRRPEAYVAAGQGRYMGCGLPQALAAACHDPRPEEPVVLFTGDGGIGMYAAEIKLAVDMGLPLAVVLLSDGGFGTLRGRCLKDGLGQGPLTVASPSWAEAMAGMGVPSVTARTVDEVAAALPERLEGPVFIEISFDTERYARMTDGLR